MKGKLDDAISLHAPSLEITQRAAKTAWKTV